MAQGALYKVHSLSLASCGFSRAILAPVGVPVIAKDTRTEGKGLSTPGWPRKGTAERWGGRGGEEGGKRSVWGPSQVLQSQESSS